MIKLWPCNTNFYIALLNGLFGDGTISYLFLNGSKTILRPNFMLLTESEQFKLYYFFFWHLVFGLWQKVIKCPMLLSSVF